MPIDVDDGGRLVVLDATSASFIQNNALVLTNFILMANT
jgi:hypothetical protein